MDKFGRKADQMNPLLVAPEVGVSKPSHHKLPPPETVFGKVCMKDEYDTSTLLHDWKEYAPNPSSKPGRDYIKMNRIGARAGVTKASEARMFHETHDMRRESGKDRKERTSSASMVHTDKDAVFGKRSGSPTDMRSLFQHDFVPERGEKLIFAKKTKKAREASPTKASLGHQKTAAATPQETSPSKAFKLRRFENVPSKIAQTWRSPTQE
eukprot:TRINITY_DN1873_c0_g1_i1.p2 TRINITY_DN1873_c0_g1~~TRINITY_DN1873_c0_g1_i1.p2  ORF type:complete len:210 (+),score=50.15 TRINITY_DN1873_c0_g1_i1:131-760(+)